MRKLFVLLTTVAVVLAFTLPAMAQAQWSFYGSARMWTSYEKVSKETVAVQTGSTAEAVSGITFGAGSRAASWTAGATGAQDDSEIDWKLQTNSRIGANVKWGDIGGRFEYGSAPNLRLLYGTWSFSKDGSLLLGQDYTPYMYLVSGMCGPGGGECNGIGLGSIYGGRLPQLKLTYMGFQFALATPASAAVPVYGNTAFAGAASTSTVPFVTAFPSGTRDVDQTMPRVEASYSANVGPVNLYLGGLWNQYKIEYALTGGSKQDTTVNTYLIGAGGKFAYGPFYINATGQYGRNPNNGNGFANVIPAVFMLNAATNKSEDAEYWAGLGVIGFKLSDMIAFEGGYVHQYAKVKDPVNSTATQTIDLEQTTSSWYVQSVISPAKNFFIVPEVGVMDFKDLKVSTFSDRKMGDIFWFGLKWQINF